MNVTAEAVNWALERAALLADESCECGVGRKLAEAIRGLKVEHASIEIGSAEDMEELGALESFAAARAADDCGALQELGAPVVEAEQRAMIASAPPHNCDRGGPMIPVDGAYRFSCSACGLPQPAAMGSPSS